MPIIKCWQFQGISSADKGVCPYSLRDFFEGLFLRFGTSPWISPLGPTALCAGCA